MLTRTSSLKLDNALQGPSYQQGNFQVNIRILGQCNFITKAWQLVFFVSLACLYKRKLSFCEMRATHTGWRRLRRTRQRRLWRTRWLWGTREFPGSSNCLRQFLPSLKAACSAVAFLITEAIFLAWFSLPRSFVRNASNCQWDKPDTSHRSWRGRRSGYLIMSNLVGCCRVAAAMGVDLQGGIQ